MRLPVETADKITEKSTLNSNMATSRVTGFERKYSTSIEMLGSSDRQEGANGVCDRLKHSLVVLPDSVPIYSRGWLLDGQVLWEIYQKRSVLP